MELRLDEPEVALVREMLDHAYRELRYEISNTSTSTFKDQLRAQESALTAVLDKFGGPLPDA